LPQAVICGQSRSKVFATTAAVRRLASNRISTASSAADRARALSRLAKRSCAGGRAKGSFSAGGPPSARWCRSARP